MRAACPRSFSPLRVRALAAAEYGLRQFAQCFGAHETAREIFESSSFSYIYKE